MSNLIQEFFDLERSCPDKIPDCQRLREQYQAEIKAVRDKGCKSCAESKIKVKYMEIVWNAFMDALN